MSDSSQPDYKSRVPHSIFAETLLEQQAQLAVNPLITRFQQSRQRMEDERYRPLYHFVPPEGSLNDPNGLCFWQGAWHLFYQAFPPEDPRPHWGHAISDDLMHWRDLPYAIYPQPEAASWSGSTLVEDDRVIAIYFGLEVGNMVAISHDPLLLNWHKVTGHAVIPTPCPIWEPLRSPALPVGLCGQPLPLGAINFIYDPCIWKKDGMSYSLSGGTLPHVPSGKRTRAEFLFRSPDLKQWEYLHPFIEGDIFGKAGDDGACPYFWPIGDRYILLHFSHMSGGQYLLGDYDTARDKFVTTAGGSFNFGPWYPGGLHAPTATPDNHGGVLALFNINPGKQTFPGSNQILSLPRRLTLLEGDELGMEPAGDFASLRKDHLQIPSQTLPANQEIVLNDIQGDALEIIAKIELREASVIELNVLRSPGTEEYTRITFYHRCGFRNWERHPGWEWPIVRETSDSLISIDTAHSSQLPDVPARAPETAPVFVKPGEPLQLHVFIDKSVLEVFVNGRQCLTLRVYPGRSDSLGVSLLAQGQDAKLLEFDAWQMNSI